MKIESQNVLNILDNMYEGLYLVDRNRVITYWNKAAEKISGFSADQVVGMSCSDNILNHVDSEGIPLCQSGCPLLETIKDGEQRESFVYMHHKDGHRVPVSVRTTILTNEFGTITGGIELFTDISNIQSYELKLQELEQLALLDQLTQLANRHYLESELKSRFEEYSRYKLGFGLLILDIDHFKKVNDTYGHDVGDLVLKSVGKTLKNSGRPFDIFGRWGGEEFIGVIKNVSSKDLEKIANRLLSLVSSSFIIVNDKKISVNISIGGTIIKESDDSDTIIKRADQLLYISKNNGRNRATID